MRFKEIMGILVHGPRILTIGYVLTSMVTWLISLLLPYIMGRIIDHMVYGKGAHMVYRNAELLLGIAIIELFTTFYSRLLKAHIRRMAVFSLLFKIYEHVGRVSTSYLSSIDKNYLAQRINQDVNQLYSFILEQGLSLVWNTLSFIAILFITWRINSLICMSFLFLIPIYVISFITFRKKLFQKAYLAKEFQNSFFAALNHHLVKMKSIKANCWFEQFNEKIKGDFRKMFASSQDYSRTLYHSLNSEILIKRSSNILLFVYGGILLIHRKITIGYFSMISIYFGMILANIGFFLRFGQSYQQTLVCYRRINEILLKEEEKNGSRCLNEIKEIEFKDVTFSYGNKKLIRNLTLNLRTGNIYVIKGENGSGKSTFIDLLIGLNRDYTGEILFDNQDIALIDMYEARANLLGIVEQEPDLVTDNITEDVTFGLRNHDYCDSDVSRVCNGLGISQLLGKCCVNVSGGEKQKIALARIMLKSPTVLVLDEPTSALDKAGKEYLVSYLKGKKRGRITIVVTHDEELMKEADFIVSLG